MDLNDLLTSNEELLSLLVHNTNVFSGPVIESALIKKKKRKKKIWELMMKGYKTDRTAYEIDSSLVQCKCRMNLINLAARLESFRHLSCNQ